MTDETPQRRGLRLSGRFCELESLLCERVAELRRDRPLAPLTVVVGSAAVRTHIVDLLVTRLTALANVRVVTLGAFTADLVAARRGAPGTVLSGLARERFLRRLLDDQAGELRYFSAVLQRPNFARALAATFADLREACVDPGSDWAGALVSAGGQGSARQSAKAADLRRLYRGYCDELSRRQLLDGAASCLEAAAAVAAGAGPAAAIVYGIYDVNQAQEVLLSRLAAAGADLFVPVPSGRTTHVAPDWMAAGDGPMTAGVPASSDAPETGEAVGSRDLERVAVMWSEPAESGERRRLGFVGDGSLSILSVADDRAERREAVRAVIAAAAEQPSDGVPTAFHRCAVVVPRRDDLERMASALTAAGVPVAARRPDRSVGVAIMRGLADCLAPSAGAPFARRAVIDFLTVAPLRDGPPQPAEAALWLDEARRAGVVAGLDEWQSRVARRRRGLERRLDDIATLPGDTIDDHDEKVADMRRRLVARRQAATLLEAAAGRLAAACGRLPADASPWDAWADGFAAVAEALFEPPAAASARDVADRLRALAVVDELVTAGEAASVLRTLAESGSVAEGRVGRDGVAVLTPLDVRGLSFDTVVFTGLAEGGFPSPGRPDPIIGDGDRRRVAEATAVRLPLAEQRGDEADLLFAFACEAARRRLVLISPRGDAASGRPRLPSRLLLRLAAAGAGGLVGVDDFLVGHGLAGVWRRVSGPPRYEGSVDRWVDAREHDTQALARVCEHGDGAEAEAYLAAVLGDPDAAGRRLRAWAASRGADPGEYDGVLGARAGEALRDLPIALRPFAGELSATRLERYISCPFAFFLHDLLGLRPPEEPGTSLEMEPLEFGKLAHAILHHTYRRVVDEELTRDAALAALAEAWLAGCAEAEQRGLTGAALAWSVRKLMLLDDLRETIRRDRVFDGDARPVAIEWAFGAADAGPVRLALSGGREVAFRGRIDRFDETPSGARVIDYKTGTCNSERDRVKNRLSVQLPVYQLAVRQAGGDYREIVCEYRPVTRRGGFEPVPLADDEAAAGQRLAELVAAALELVDAGMFPRTTAGRCDFCDVGYACGISAWQRARKREHEALAGVVTLQTRPPKESDDGV